jgi:hypothetical protein
MRLSVYDLDDLSATASVEQNLIGNADFYLDELIRVPNHALSVRIKG